jgi:hypothetical protein
MLATIAFSLQFTEVYFNFEGTSMAAPHQSGLYALLLSFNKPETRIPSYALELKSIMQTSANPAPLSNEDRTLFAPVALQGSGVPNITAAIQSQLRISSSTLGAKSTAWDKTSDVAEPTIFTLTLENTGKMPLHLIINQTEAALVSIQNIYNPKPYRPVAKNETGATSIDIDKTTLVLGPKEKTQICIRIQGPSKSATDSLDKDSFSWMFSGYIFIHDSCGHRYTIPYSGVVGQFNKFPALDLVNFLLDANHLVSPKSNVILQIIRRPTFP